LTAIVIDASVDIKWFVPEGHATEPRQGRSVMCHAQV
jgi:hypothetical protein